MRFVGSSQELPLESYDKTQGKCTEISGEELCHMRRLTKLTTFIRLPNSSSCMLRVFAKTYIQLVFFFPLFFFFLPEIKLWQITTETSGMDRKYLCICVEFPAKQNGTNVLRYSKYTHINKHAHQKRFLFQNNLHYMRIIIIVISIDWF